MKRFYKLLLTEAVLVVAAIFFAVGIFTPCAEAREMGKVNNQAVLSVVSLEYTIQAKYNAPNKEPVPTPCYDVPISQDTQNYVSKLCRNYSVPETLIYAIMSKESNFTPDIISYTDDYGIMQINEMNHPWLSDELGITDFLDERQNILAGVYILSELYKQFDTTEQVLLAYNCGPTGARNLIKQGITQTEYTQSVLKEMDYIRRIENE
ncbi:lytic transglycosylase domain-containing protein [Anaerovorax sp. IOR16]|uniref:lytic transglycosylase domain-containing protein n=1 Tax=Anaerovorax sp. IOR16 TaxID=2773458 RepID=UPI0019CFB5D3|nr:lytic transglycosylase domain-containing protein [Anaerovorax sp. IOR16]